MSVAAEHGTTARPVSPTPPMDAAPGSGQVPRLAEGVELLGEYQNSGYSQPPSLIRRLFALAGLACLTALAVFWNAQGQFRGW